jgi:Baseplate J-like protein
MEAPQIDKRSYQDLVAETEALARDLTTWRPRPDGQPDGGQALIRIFAGMAELVVHRLNQAPEKNYLAFLNLIGTSMLPPQPARVPLTFQLASNSPVDAVVPAGTQASAPAPEGEEDELVFETERSLFVSRAGLQAVYVSDTDTDSYADRTVQATGEADEPFAVFAADQPTPHELYLAWDQLLLGPGPKDLTVTLQLADPWQGSGWPITWAYWDGDGWRPVTGTPRYEGSAWRVTLSQLPPLTPHEVHGTEAGWLRAELGLRLPSAGSGVPESVAVGGRNPQDLALPLSPFGETTAVRRFYLSADEAFAARGARVRLRVGLSRPGVAANLQLSWFYQAGDQWVSLGQSSTGADQVGSSGFGFRDGTFAFTRDGDVSFQLPAGWPRSLYRTRTGRWLRVDVTGDAQYATLPQVGSLTVGYDWDVPRLSAVTARLRTSPEPSPAASAFFNASPIDTSKDFYPLGEQPRFNDTFYVACPAEVAGSGAAVTLNVTLTNPPGAAESPVPPVRTQDGPRLAWELWDGRQWHPTAADYAFTESSVSIALPDPIGKTSVNGVEGYWVRGRLVGGHYGTPAGYTRTADGSYVPVESTLAPPVVASVSFVPAGPEQAEVPPSACLSYNDFEFVDRTAAAAGQAPPFTPFTSTVDSRPALYLGLDRPFGNKPVTLYLWLEPPRPEEVAADALAELDSTSPAEVVWEYSSPTGWRLLGALDETLMLGERGLVRFVGPTDLTARSRFGQVCYWLRARWNEGTFPFPPRLRGVLLNTTWAAQVSTVRDEILGSSNGNPDQVFATAQSPVQPGQHVVVREPEPPLPDERGALLAEEGADAVTVTLDDAGQPDEVWVRWHPVPDFHGSGQHDRHYTVDPLTGEIRFGDGSAGRIPPRGQNNVRITYRTGGSEKGNVPPDTVVQLRSAIPYVEAVTNHEPAQGGAPREPVERVKARGPLLLRHRDRAVTAEDLVDLAVAASTEVARAAAIAPIFDPSDLWLEPKGSPTADHASVEAGRMGVIVVPDSDAVRPTPSVGLVRRVRTYLEDRCPPTAELWVSGPEWIAVTVTARVAATSLETADALPGRVADTLGRFLHPLTGGPLGQGWAFGRTPRHSELIALVETVEGVDHVRSLDMSLEPETSNLDHRQLRSMLSRPLAEASAPPTRDGQLRRWLGRALIYSGQHGIEVVSG